MTALATLLAAGLAAALPIALVQNRGLVPLVAAMAVAAFSVLAPRWRMVLARAAAGPFAAAAALGLWGVLSSLWALAPGPALGSGLRLLALIVALSAVVAASAELGEAGVRRLLVGCVAGVSFGVALLAVELLAGAPLNNVLRGFPVPPRNAEVTKPAATLLALLAAPAALAASRLAGGRAAIAIGLASIAVVLVSTSEAARLGVLAAIGAGAVALAFPALARRVLPALFALAVLAGPPLLDQFARGATRAGLLPLSAVHRTLIWDYAAERAAERPLVGFGMDAARSLPGGREHPAVAQLDELNIQGAIRDFFITAPRGAAELIPLHTHSMPLQIRLELGFVGLALLAVFAVLCGRAVAALPGRDLFAAGSAVASATLVVSLLSYGAWQHWWWISVTLAAMPLAALSARGGR